MTGNLRIDLARLISRLERLAQIGAIPGGGVCRLALTDADRQGRDLVRRWMEDLGLSVTIDAIGNVVAVMPGATDLPPVMIGSHIDTVRTGGRYDGALGVLAGLEIVEVLRDAGHVPHRPIAIAFFTNEEGARFAPDMMGSLVHQGQLDLAAMLDVPGIDGTRVGDELVRIGYAGPAPVNAGPPHAFVELHIEQGPVLEREGVTIGAVEGVQGIAWTEVAIEGVSNHAGTTPMALRCDAGYAAAALAVFVRDLARELGGAQVGTVGAITLSPNLVNVVANRAVVTVDLRNTDDAILTAAEHRLGVYLSDLAGAEGVSVRHRQLARFAPVAFDPAMITLVEQTARDLGLSVRRMPSGAGHDAQAFAPNCPTGMVFVPSADGLSHNVAEHTDLVDIEAGANVLLEVVLAKAAEDGGTGP